MGIRPRTPERAELAAFLKSRRGRLSPAQVGLATTVRRRTPGLRREEVAHLAGVGVTWYTWLEQGRPIDVSTHFLERIVSALRLDAMERVHLFTLAQDRPPPIGAGHSSRVTPALERLLEAVAGPAYLATAAMDVVAWNAALSAVFGDLAAIAEQDRNMLWLVFASTPHRAAIPNWEVDARGMLARFRIEFGRHRDDTGFLNLIDRLQRASLEFRRWWSEHDVSMSANRLMRFEVPGVGQMELERTAFQLEEAPDLRLVVYTPLDEASGAKVDRLRREWKAGRPDLHVASQSDVKPRRRRGS